MPDPFSLASEFLRCQLNSKEGVSKKLSVWCGSLSTISKSFHAGPSAYHTGSLIGQKTREKISNRDRSMSGISGFFHAGPSAYNTGTLIGQKTRLSTERVGSASKIGTMPRFRNPGEGVHGGTPGPGQYGSPSPTLESHQPCLPSVGFAKAGRDANKKVSS